MKNETARREIMQRTHKHFLTQMFRIVLIFVTAIVFILAKQNLTLADDSANTFTIRTRSLNALKLDNYTRPSVPAQSDSTPWTDPDLLTPSPDQFRVRPLITADQSGTLHAIWHEGEERGQDNWRIETIYYSSWDGVSWSQPVDILAAPSGTGGDMPQARSLVATPDGRLLIARSLDGYVVLNQAPIENASNPHAWSSTKVDLGKAPSLAISPNGEMWCLTYWADVFFSQLTLKCSYNRGKTWERPHSVWLADTNTAGNNVAALIADDGRMHLVWSEPTLRRHWNSEAIWHTVFDPQNETFQVREVLRSFSSDEPNLDNPTLTECPNGEIHLFWNNAVGTTTGRFHQYLDPQTDVWSEVTPVFPGLSGLTDKAGFVCDNTGRVHLITAAPGDGTTTSPLRYATWFDGAWSDYLTLWDERYFGERPSMVISSGNQLHVLWDSFRGIGDIRGRFIAHASRIIDADATPTYPPTAEIVTKSTSDKLEVQRSVEQTEPPDIPSADSPTPSIKWPIEEIRGQTRTNPLVISIAAVFALLVLVFMFRGSRIG